MLGGALTLRMTLNSLCCNAPSAGLGLRREDFIANLTHILFLFICILGSKVTMCLISDMSGVCRTRSTCDATKSGAREGRVQTRPHSIGSPEGTFVTGEILYSVVDWLKLLI